jgi:hypothetical protein
MKTKLFVLILILFAGFSCQEKMDIEKEKEAIKAVIEEETRAYLDQDFERLAKTHLHDETSFRMSIGKDGYQTIIGWKAIGDTLKSWTSADWEDVNAKFMNTDYKIKVYPQSAWAVFTQTWDYTYNGKQYAIPSLETRFLEKVNEEWKIVYLLNVGTYTYDEETMDSILKTETENP